MTPNMSYSWIEGDGEPADGFPYNGAQTVLSYGMVVNDDATHVVTANSLNVRLGPGITCAWVDSRPYGARVHVWRTENGWGEINLDQWVSMQYLRKL